MWQQPKVSIAQTPLVARAPVKVSVVTGGQSQRQGRKFKSIQDNIDFYGKLIEKACERDHPQLVVLPEVALQFGIEGDALDKAVPAPGPETDAFAAIAKKHRVRIASACMSAMAMRCITASCSSAQQREDRGPLSQGASRRGW